VLLKCQHPGIYIGELNSHSIEWGYATEDENGEKLSTWVNLNRQFLIYDAKQGGTFESGRWGSFTSPDLCLITKDLLDLPLQARKTIMQKLPRSQHRPLVLDVSSSSLK
jgi:hypothetical protein